LRLAPQVNGSAGYPLVYRGYFDCLRQVLLREGPRALYRGCLINCAKTVPGAGLQFVAYDLIKTSIQVGGCLPCGGLLLLPGAPLAAGAGPCSPLAGWLAARLHAPAGRGRSLWRAGGAGVASGACQLLPQPAGQPCVQCLLGAPRSPALGCTAQEPHGDCPGAAAGHVGGGPRLVGPLPPSHEARPPPCATLPLQILDPTTGASSPL
jgi:hypothetical protein